MGHYPGLQRKSLFAFAHMGKGQKPAGQRDASRGPKVKQPAAPMLPPAKEPSAGAYTALSLTGPDIRPQRLPI
jgi:hypothetical protein